MLYKSRFKDYNTGDVFFVLAILTSAVIYSALFLLISTPAFFTTKLDSLRGIVFFFREMSYYPLSIFPKALQVLLTFIVPYGMINFFPVQAVIRKNDLLMFGPYMKYAAPLFAVGLFSLAVLLFNYGVKKYKSTGN
jgi:ABC-2 type transport system permease protein